jgi:hypothetical protein
MLLFSPDIVRRSEHCADFCGGHTVLDLVHRVGELLSRTKTRLVGPCRDGGDENEEADNQLPLRVYE